MKQIVGFQFIALICCQNTHFLTKKRVFWHFSAFLSYNSFYIILNLSILVLNVVSHWVMMKQIVGSQFIALICCQNTHFWRKNVFFWHFSAFLSYNPFYIILNLSILVLNVVSHWFMMKHIVGSQIIALFWSQNTHFLRKTLIFGIFRPFLPYN